MTAEQKWQRLIRWLRKSFPPHRPIRVRTVPGKRLGRFDGVCLLREAKHPKRIEFLILVRREASYSTKADTLMHEWAHALTWFTAGPDVMHSPEWGVAHARIYSAFVGDDRWLLDGEEKG